MVIAIDSRRRSRSTLEARHAGATFIDVTSRGSDPWVRFSPFFPHGGIPVPFSPDVFGTSVEGIWQGLKVFERADVDASKLAISTMSNLKRTARRFGAVLGHRRGMSGTELLDYAVARREIFLPAYRFVLEHRVAAEVAALQQLAASGDVVLLDYDTNESLDDLSRPLSHAGLIRRHVEGTWPSK